MLPIRDSNPTRRTAWVTLALIAANVIVFLIWEPTFAAGRAGQLEQEFFFLCHAEVPWEVTHQTSLAEGGAAARVAGVPGSAVAVADCDSADFWSRLAPIPNVTSNAASVDPM